MTSVVATLAHLIEATRARRSLFLIAVAGILSLGLAAFLAVQGRAPSGLSAAEPPGNVARQLLRDESTTSCFSEIVLDYYLPPTLAVADQLPEGDQWLTEGSIYGYVGDLERAAEDLGGILTGRAGDRAWIKANDAGGPIVLQYSAVTTPKGRTLWILNSSDRPQDETLCK